MGEKNNIGRPKKEGKKITLKLEQGLYERLNEFCETFGTTQTKTIEKALDMYMKKRYTEERELKNNRNSFV